MLVGELVGAEEAARRMAVYDQRRVNYMLVVREEMVGGVARRAAGSLQFISI
jgi:hypothetical protein